MATTIDTWAVDLADVTVIYPWVGSEGLMVLVAIVLWLAWHVWQSRWEKEKYEKQIQKYGDAANVSNALDAD